ncbi:MAG: glycosyltransferase family 2 protein [Planctomycetota bacterium]
MKTAPVAVSVVIVSWNSRNHLAMCLPSLVNQAGVPIEVIVVDNFSRDGSADFVRREFPSVRLMALKDNLGFGHGCNVGAREAVGRHILFLNPDTVVAQGCIETLAAWLDSHSAAGAVAPRLQNLDGSLQPSARRLPTLWGEFCQEFRLSSLFAQSEMFSSYYMAGWDHAVERTLEAVTGASFMIRREVFNRIGGFDAEFFMYYEEMDLFKRLRQSGYTLTYLPSACVAHVGGGSTGGFNALSHGWLLNSRVLYHSKESGESAVWILWVIHVMSAVVVGLFAILADVLGVAPEKARVHRERSRFTLTHVLGRTLGP